MLKNLLPYIAFAIVLGGLAIVKYATELLFPSIAPVTLAELVLYYVMLLMLSDRLDN